MSPTMATKHVAAIEQRLGVRLLHRTTRKVTPTEIGRTFVQNAERIIAELQEAEAEAAADKLVVRGLLRVNVPVSFGTSEIAPILNDLSKAHPDLTIDLGVNDRLVDLVEEGRSEEHTSELQSLMRISYAVFCLKKKNNN